LTPRDKGAVAEKSWTRATPDEVIAKLVLM